MGQTVVACNQVKTLFVLSYSGMQGAFLLLRFTAAGEPSYDDM
jgi:hypothetical protein